MLLAPLSLPEPRTRRRDRPGAGLPAVATSPARRGEGDSIVPAFLLGWLTLGLGLVVFVPAMRGGGLLGATAPFWLVGAPVLNLLWWKRRECLTALRQRLRARSRHRAGARARRQPR